MLPKFSINKTLQIFIFFIGLYFVCSYLFIVINRITYPFELEWMEGGTLMHIKKLVEGLDIYTSPSIDFIPAIYTPFYYYISKIAVSIWGFNFFSIRMISFISSILILFNIYLITLEIIKDKTFSFIAVSFFIASFNASGSWLDIGRVDSLAYFLLTSGFYMVLKKKLISVAVIAPIIFILAYLTKQNILIFALGAIFFIYYFDKRACIYFTIVFLCGLLITHLLYDIFTDGWFSYYTLTLSNSLETKFNKLFTFWLNDIIKTYPIAILAILFLFLNSKNSHNILPSKFLIFLIAFLIISYFPRVKIGGFENALIPAFIGISIYSSISMKYLFDELPLKFQKFLFLTVIIQLLLLYYPIAEHIPSSIDKKTGETLLSELKSIKGNIFFPDHPFYLFLIGKESQAQSMAISDFINSKTKTEYKNKLLKEISNRIKNKYYEALIFDRKDFLLRIFEKEIYENYNLVDSNLTGNFFVPVTGGPNKPTFLFLKK